MLTQYIRAQLADLPIPKPFRELSMTTSSERHFACWYHAIDWVQANNLAVDALLALGPVLDTEAVMNALGDPPDPQGLADAALSLFLEPIVVSAPPEGVLAEYINGQHRIRAMLDQQVKWTVIEQNPPTDLRVIAQDSSARLTSEERDGRSKGCAGL